jgi:menaquinone-dependent protoporphyrinogen oxidase
MTAPSDPASEPRPKILHVLVAFASHEGQTEKIAHHAARVIEDRGHLARLVDVRADDTTDALEGIDAAILAASLHIGAHDPALAAFARQHAVRLGPMPSAFLSISLTAASADAAERAAIDQIVHSFQQATGWRPGRVALVAGAVHDREMNVIERYVIHRIVDAHGVERHPSGDTELTDWPALDAFLRGFITEATARGAPHDDT